MRSPAPPGVGQANLFGAPQLLDAGLVRHRPAGQPGPDAGRHRQGDPGAERGRRRSGGSARARSATTSSSSSTCRPRGGWSRRSSSATSSSAPTRMDRCCACATWRRWSSARRTWTREARLERQARGVDRHLPLARRQRRLHRRGGAQDAGPAVRPVPAGAARPACFYDSTTFVSDTIHEVLTTLFIAFGLVVLVVFLFLGNVRATLIPIVAVPVSLIGTFAGAAGARLFGQHRLAARDGAGDRHRGR